MIGIFFAWTAAMALVALLAGAHRWSPRLLPAVALSLMSWCSLLALVGCGLRAGW